MFDKKSLMNNRYQLLASTSSRTEHAPIAENEESTSYADFLSKFGRFLSKDGYVDSEQTIHRANLTRPRRKSLSDITGGGGGGGGGNGGVGGGIGRRHDTANMSMTSSNRTSNKTNKSVTLNMSSVDIASLVPKKDKMYERHLKQIEDQMIKSKQDERAFKRQDGDVKKEQRQIRQSVREFDKSKYNV